MIEYIKSDMYRKTGKISFKSFLKIYWKDSGFRFLVAFRTVNASGFMKIVGCFLWFIRNKKQIHISRHTKIGYGLFIGHGGPVVINPSTIIGNNCNLSQFVSIGSNEGKSAMIGDNVYIGPNSCLVEDIKVGDNATIGAGSVVTKDVPKDATVAGNYAKVLNYNLKGKYITNRWPIETGEV